LPVRLRIHQRWNLLYSLNQHGVSFTSLLRLSKDKGPCLLLIRDENDNIFGGFLSEPISPHPSFYGSGECFLWKKSWPLPSIKVFKWTGDNDYFIATDSDYVAMGSGNGLFGLWFDSDFEHGYSAPCPTFNNESLINNG
ncbi:TLD-domain-containing protein, partial [Ramicandelaber brevisporus]